MLLCVQLVARQHLLRHPRRQNMPGRKVIVNLEETKCWHTAAGVETAGGDGASGVLVSATTGMAARPGGDRTDA